MMHGQKNINQCAYLYNVYTGDSGHKSQAPSCLGD